MRWSEEELGRPLLRGLLAIGAAVMTLVGCGGDDETDSGPSPDEVRVAAFNFPESELLAEIYAQALEERGVPVRRLGSVGSREVVAPALELGLIDVVPEYAGTMLSFVSLGANEPTFDSEATIDQLRETLGPRGLIVLDPANAQNKNTFVVTRAFAAENDLRQLSDLAAIADTLTFGGPSECSERLFCLIGLRDVYGIEFADVVPLRNSPVVAESLRFGEIDVGLMFTTDAEMVDTDLTALLDDRGLQPAENVVPVVRWTTLTQWSPDVLDALNDVSSRLETSDLALLNMRAQAPDADIAELARLWLES